MLKAMHGSHSPRFDVKGLAVACTELFTKIRDEPQDMQLFSGRCLFNSSLVRRNSNLQGSPHSVCLLVLIALISVACGHQLVFQIPSLHLVLAEQSGAT